LKTNDEMSTYRKDKHRKRKIKKDVDGEMIKNVETRKTGKLKTAETIKGKCMVSEV
jgi:hypothetical protein